MGAMCSFCIRNPSTRKENMNNGIGVTERGDAALDYNEATYKARKLNVAGAILITKSPNILIDLLRDRPFPTPFVVNCTITGFGGEPIEPNVPKPEVALKAYHDLIAMYGGQRVVLRVDPIILEGRAMPIIKLAEGRVRISFLDGYAHVRERFANRCPEYSPLLPHDFHHPIERRRSAVEYITRELGYAPEICGEPGLPCAGCVSQNDLDALKLAIPARGKSYQRKDCHCLSQKVELLSRRNPCPHNCCYCYWRD